MVAEKKESKTKGRILVAYYSRDGHAEKIARELAVMLEADVDAIKPERGYGGKDGYDRAGKEASLWKRPPIKFSKDPSSYDLLVVGTPMWVFNMSSPVRSYIYLNKDKMKEAAFFSSGGSPFRFATWFMEREYGKKPLAVMNVRQNEVDEGAYKAKLKAFADAIKSS